MNLPIEILDAPTTRPVLLVDGAWDQPGLNLSHWPGHRTPAHLRHDLSTGSALAFARLPAAERESLARGCEAIANNHYDTDGACAVFAVRHPELALARANELLAAAAAGDFFRLPSERAFALDLWIAGVADPERSPWAGELRGLAERERHQVALRAVVAQFAAVLDASEVPNPELWREALEELRHDQADVAAAARDEVVHLDLCVVTAASGTRSRRGARAFDPGRHALFGSTDADRVLVIGPATAGATYRFLLSTLSWFDLVSRKRLSRPDLARLAAQLNELEGTAPDASVAWRAQASASPSPELWFGRPEHVMFAEHAEALEVSKLAPALVRRTLLDALREAWSFPD